MKNIASYIAGYMSASAILLLVTVMAQAGAPLLAVIFISLSIGIISAIVSAILMNEMED